MDEIFERIDQAGHIVLIAHIDPDADSLGSASAMYTHLMRLHKKTTLFCASDRIDQDLSFLPWYDKIRHTFPVQADLAISFDCATFSRLGALKVSELINIDHHSSNSGYGTIDHIDTKAISTTQVLYGLFRKEEIKINTKMATALYAGLLDDSQGFTTAKTDAAIFEMAADLVRCGADTQTCSRALMQTMSLAGMRLKGMMLQQARLLSEARIVAMSVSRNMMESSGARAVDCEAALQESLYLPTVKSAVMIRENTDGTLKGSLRAREGVDVAKVAKVFGGGGHRHAAGFEVSGGTIDSVMEKTIKLLDKELN